VSVKGTLVKVADLSEDNREGIRWLSATEPDCGVTIVEEDFRAMRSFKEMLPFYGLQLQSHASVLVGLVLLVFAIVQAWASLPQEVKSLPYHGLVFSVVAGMIGAGIVFVVLRLYVYGKLASALMYATYDGLHESKSSYAVDSPGSWELLPDLTKVNIYTQRIFERNAKMWIWLKVFDRTLHVRAWIFGVAFEIWFLLSYGLIFGGVDLSGLGQYAMWSILVVANGLALLWDIKLVRQRLKRHAA